jgi:hypothetical protein
MADSNVPSLTLAMAHPELIMWDGEGTAYMLARDVVPTMGVREKAITLALLKLAIGQLEQ